MEPATLQEALSLLAKYGKEAKVLAGGQSLIVMMREGLVSPKVVISLRRLPELSGISDGGGEGVTIGAMTTYRTLERSPLIQERCGLLAQMVKVVATPQVRNKGTIGGSVCHAAPDADPPPCLLVLDARAVIAGPGGQREVPLDGFFLEPFQTSLASDEILVALRIPPSPPRTGNSYLKYSSRKALDPPSLG